MLNRERENKLGKEEKRKLGETVDEERKTEKSPLSWTPVSFYRSLKEKN